MQYNFAVKGGKLPSSKGRGCNQGKTCHVVVGDYFSDGCFNQALCGVSPGKRGYGWLVASELELNCPKCKKLLDNHRESV